MYENVAKPWFALHERSMSLTIDRIHKDSSHLFRSGVNIGLGNLFDTLMKVIIIPI